MVFKGICLFILGISAFSSHAQLIDYSRWSQEEKENRENYVFSRASHRVIAASTYDTDIHLVGFHGLIFHNSEEFNQFIVKGNKIKIPKM